MPFFEIHESPLLFPCVKYSFLTQIHQMASGEQELSEQ